MRYVTSSLLTHLSRLSAMTVKKCKQGTERDSACSAIEDCSVVSLYSVRH